MHSTAFSASAGEQLAEAVLAAALALPLAFAVGGLKSSRLIRRAAPQQTIEWSSAPNSLRQPLQTLDPPMPALGLRRTAETKAESRSSEARGEIQKNRIAAGVAVPISRAGDGAQTDSIAAAGLGILAAFAKTEDMVIYFPQPKADLVEAPSESSHVSFEASQPEGGNVFAPVIEGHDARATIDDNEQQ